MCVYDATFGCGGGRVAEGRLSIKRTNATGDQVLSQLTFGQSPVGWAMTRTVSRSWSLGLVNTFLRLVKGTWLTR